MTRLFVLRRKSRFVTFLLGLSLLLCSAVRVDAEQPAKKNPPPNVVFFLIDDMGWPDLSCYGNQFVETPHIDRLAGQGMRFTEAYAACPVCSPTRASIMTGKYPARLGITDFIPGHSRPFEKLKVPQNDSFLPLEEVTLGEVLHGGGYATCYLGKWHLGGDKYYPEFQGFDVSMVQSGPHFGTRLTGTHPAKLAEDEYLAERLTDESIAFIRKNKDRPFFVYLAHYAVHIPLMARQEKIAKYEKKAASFGGEAPCQPVYAAMCEHVDDSVGRVMAALDETGLADNTLVVFFSDNGGLIRSAAAGRDTGQAITTLGPLRGEKGTVYEGGIRVPCIVRLPGVIEPGSTCDVPITSVDFLPTIAEICHRPLAEPVDGISIVPLLSGQGTIRRDGIYWHYPHYHHMDPAGAVLAGDYKLVEHFEDGRLELFNLRQDIGEKENLADILPDKARQMQMQLSLWRDRTAARMPTPNPDYDPDRAGQSGKRQRERGGE